MRPFDPTEGPRRFPPQVRSPRGWRRHYWPGTQINRVLPQRRRLSHIQPPTMKAAFLSLLALVSVVLAVPPYNPQSVLNVPSQDIQNAREGVNPIFDKAEDKVLQWVQDGRDFIDHNGLICQFMFHNILLHVSQ